MELCCAWPAELFQGTLAGAVRAVHAAHAVRAAAQLLLEALVAEMPHPQVCDGVM